MTLHTKRPSVERFPCCCNSSNFNSRVDKGPFLASRPFDSYDINLDAAAFLQHLDAHGRVNLYILSAILFDTVTWLAMVSRSSGMDFPSRLAVLLKIKGLVVKILGGKARVSINSIFRTVFF
jgi:hypothetical protein